MKINSAMIISLATLVVGLLFRQPYLWIPLTILVAGTIDLFTRDWVISNKLGTARNTSMIIKLSLMVIGLYGLIGQVFCVGLVVYWLFY